MVTENEIKNKNLISSCLVTLLKLLTPLKLQLRKIPVSKGAGREQFEFDKDAPFDDDVKESQFPLNFFYLDSLFYFIFFSVTNFL